MLAVSIPALLLGWMSPGYAAKCFGPELNIFLHDQPVIAALVMQSTWMLLFLAPAFSTTDARSEGGVASVQASRSDAWWLALKFGLPLGVLVALVHVSWYASIPRTSVATNTVLWNSDTISTPLLAALFSLQQPHCVMVLAGVIGLLGVSCSVSTNQVGNSNLGCGLCLAATTGYAVNAIFAEKVSNKYPATLSVLQLLALQGLTAGLMLISAVIGAAALAPKLLEDWYSQIPSPPWLAFLAASGLCLNVGWLVSTRVAGASWTAMGACLSIPLSMVLDLILLDMMPDLLAVLGALLVLLGFAIVSLMPDLSPSNCGGWLSRSSAPLLLSVENTEENPANEPTATKDELC